MSETNFTPGPWRATKNSVESTDEQVDGGDIICESPQGSNASMLRWQANTSLIAQAPAMYAAIEQLMEQLEWYYQDSNGEKMDVMENDVYVSAKSILAAARG